MNRWLAAGAVLAVGLVATGHGYLNGDAAVYAAQGWTGEVWTRPTHVLWAALAVALAPLFGALLPWALDVVTALCGAALVGLGAKDVDGSLVAAGFVLPWCAFAEVDLPWMIAVLAASRVTGWGWSTALLAVGVSVSPVALLAAPWVWIERKDPRVLLGPIGMVIALLILSQGDWWLGHRGVWTTQSMPGRTLMAWATSGVAVMAVTKNLRLLALAPLLLAPPDVPAWVLVGVAGARDWPINSWSRGLALAAMVTGLWRLETRRATVAKEDRVLRQVVVGPGQGIEAPWSWGARWSVIHSGTPYESPWVAISPVRALPQGWTEVGLLPPGRRRNLNGRVDGADIAWVAPWWSADEGAVQPPEPD